VDLTVVASEFLGQRWSRLLHETTRRSWTYLVVGTGVDPVTSRFSGAI
jgi:hypothetical protein